MKVKIEVEIECVGDSCVLCRYLNTSIDVTHGKGAVDKTAEYWCGLFFEPLDGPNRCGECIEEVLKNNPEEQAKLSGEVAQKT